MPPYIAEGPMAKFSTSYTNTISNLNMIFLNSYGSSFKIFIQVEDIHNRPKLVRSVRNAGAVICSEPKDADIILVDSSTSAGRRFIRCWSSNPGIVLLEYSWARKCLDVGRALLMAENWGGLEAVDDGQPIETDGTLEEDSNPLPTPRPTPTDSIPPSHTHVQYSTSPTSSQQPVKWSSSSGGPSSALMPPPLPPSPSNIPPPQAALSLIQAPSALSTQIDMPITPTQYSLFMTLMDIMRHKRFDTSSFQAQLTSLEQSEAALHSRTLPLGDPYQDHFTSNDSMMNNTVNPSALSSFPDHRGGNKFTANDGMVNTVNSSAMTPFHDHRSRDFALSPPISSAPLAEYEYRDTSQSLYPSSSSKKQRIKLQSPERRSFSVSMSSATPEFSSRPPTPPSTQVPPSTQAPPSTPGVDKNLGQIFLSRPGRPFRFFVQVDLQGRHGIVMAIKRNQGKIVNNISDADYVILFTRSKTFPGLSKEAKNANKLPLQSSFILDCVKEGVLLDDADYALDCDTTPHSRRHSLTKSAQKSTEYAKEKEVIRKSSKKSLYSSQRPSSPSLSPAASQIPEPENYSQGDLAFFLRYARSLVESDPSITTVAIGQKVHDKIPHHSLQSWQTYISHHLGMELDQIREDVARSKSQNQNMKDEPPRMSQRQRQNDNQYDRSVPSKKRRIDPSPYEDNGQNGNPVFSKSMDDAVADDIANISHFFANGGGDDNDDERVWDNLRKYRPCRSAESWPEFYQNHMDVVQAEIQRLVPEAGLVYPEESEMFILPNLSDDVYPYIK